MKHGWIGMVLGLVSLSASLVEAQQTVATNTNVTVPPLVNFSGVLSDLNGKPLTNLTGVTFLLYKDAQGGAPLWLETQNVQPDESGHYTVILGSTSSQGLPSDIFVAGEAHWLAVQISGQSEQPRVLLVAVPYALKAGDAQTIGGLPSSAFVLAAPGAASMTPSASANGSGTTLPQSSTVPATQDVTTAGGTVNAIPLFDAASDISNSAISQTGAGTAAKIGIGTTTPASTLDVKGSSTVRGTLSLPATGVATATGGKNSQAQTLAASAFSTTTSTAVAQTFQWQAEPVGNNTAGATGSLNLLFGQGTSKPAETGLNIASNGQVTFAIGQTFPGAGTITGVTAGTGLIGGGSTGSITLNVDTTKIPQLNAANTFTGNQTVNGNLTATGIVSGSGFQIGSNLFDSGNYANANAYTGFAGNTITTGLYNTGSGVQALAANTLGNSNTAFGQQALYSNTGDVNGAGSWNTAVGVGAMYFNTLGVQNTAVGFFALRNNVGDDFGSGWSNTAIGMQALFSNTSGASNTATGFDALSSNTLGSNNVAVGFEALYSNTGNNSGNGSNNAAIGTSALYSNTSGYYNTATGTSALYSNTSGFFNTAMGSGALNDNTTGNDNTAMGSGALYNSITGGGNVGLGFEALNISTSSSNTGVGNTALQYVTTGDANTGVGNNAGKTIDTSNITGKNNTALGTGTGFKTGTLTNATALGANAEVDISNALVLGSINGVNGQSVTVKVGIGTTSPDSNLTVNGTADKPGGGSWGTYSDGRLKMLDGNFDSGLQEILKIRPVRYRYKADNAMGIQDSDEHIGVVAQEVQHAIPEAVTENNKGYLLVNNDPIVWAMLNAIKEQQKLIRKEQQQIHEQQVQITRLGSKLKAIQTSLATAR